MGRESRASRCLTLNRSAGDRGPRQPVVTPHRRRAAAGTLRRHRKPGADLRGRPRDLSWSRTGTGVHPAGRWDSGSECRIDRAFSTVLRLPRTRGNAREARRMRRKGSARKRAGSGCVQAGFQRLLARLLNDETSLVEEPILLQYPLDKVQVVESLPVPASCLAFSLFHREPCPTRPRPARMPVLPSVPRTRPGYRRECPRLSGDPMPCRAHAVGP